jgi:hypothetical protein
MFSPFFPHRPTLLSDLSHKLRRKAAIRIISHAIRTSRTADIDPRLWIDPMTVGTIPIAFPQTLAVSLRDNKRGTTINKC